MQPAVDDRPAGRFGIAEITIDRGAGADQNFSAVVDPDFDARHRLADTVQRNLSFWLRGGQGRSLGLAVELAEIDAKRAKEQKRVLPHGFAPGIGAAGVRHAEKILDRPKHKNFAKEAGEPVGEARRFARQSRRSRSIARGMK